jgi:methylenetetrahydrofolate reductase (NADPH)
VYERALVLAEVCDGINATDASGANVHMSSVGVCALLTRAGYEPVMQVSCRDRNRIAIQGDLLGAAAMGVATSSASPATVSVGDQPQAKPVFDLDSIQPAAHRPHHARPGHFLSGRKLDRGPAPLPGRSGQPLCATL